MGGKIEGKTEKSKERNEGENWWKKRILKWKIGEKREKEREKWVSWIEWKGELQLMNECRKWKGSPATKYLHFHFSQ